MKLALIQLNPTIGDIAGNAAKMAEWSAKAEAAGAEMVVFPELALTGYPPRDLLLQEEFLEAVRREALGLAEQSGRAMVVFGLPWKPPEVPGAPEAWDDHARITNALLVVQGGKVMARHDKRLLPTYDVFDEDRYFHPGARAVTVDVGGVRVGLSICEDLWRGDDAGALDRYAGMADPVDELVAAGARVIVNPSASPFVIGKGARQREILRRHVRKHGVWVAAVNQVGANDDLIFDGHACAYAPDGTGGARLVAAGNGFVEAMVLVDVGTAAGKEVADPLLEAEEMSLLWRALVLGVRDYCGKLGFKKAMLGLSGGIDSALTACIAAAALGAENVLGVGMPSVYSSAGSVSDAKDLAERVGLQWVLAPIGPGHEVMKQSLAPVYDAIGAGGYVNDLSDENLQSRLRGVTVMAISNKTGALLLTTGNKSELAVGYCTLYGDMNGGLAVLSDVFKVDVYRLSRWLNAHFKECGFRVAPIPESSITKAPSAELRPNQTDQDSLPVYEVLDAVVERYVEKLQSPARIAKETGFDLALVTKIARMIDGAEFKRKQMPIGLKVSGIAFGRGRRRPIVQRFRG